MNFSKLYLRNDDYENIMFSNPLTVHLGKYNLRYLSEFDLFNEVMFMSRDLDCDGDVTAIGTTAELVSEEELEKEGWRSFEEQFRLALNAAEQRYSGFYGSPIKLCCDQETALTSVMFDLQDALYEAIENEKDADAEDVFQAFIGVQGYLWWADIVGIDKAIELCREFFDKFYPRYRVRYGKRD